MFAIRDLSVLNYANGYTTWHYKAGNDAAKEVARDMFASGDGIIVSGPWGGMLRFISILDDGIVRTRPPVSAA